MHVPDRRQEHLLQTTAALVETLLASLHDVNEQLNTLDRDLCSQKSNEPGALTVARQQSEEDLLRIELMLLRSSLEHALLILQLQQSRLLLQSRRWARTLLLPLDVPETLSWHEFPLD